jgi:ribosomal protein S12 methylthiotransferase
MVERYRGELATSLPEVDQFISTDELLNVGLDGDTSEECFQQARRPYFLYDESTPRIRSTDNHFAYLKVAEGCNRPCAFCIIPKIRGGFRSRPIQSVCDEAELLLSEGVRELNLVAQDLTAYGSDFAGNRGVKSVLPELLDRLSGLRSPEAEFWVRLLYAYPIGVNADLLRAIQSNSHICNYLDIPLQHISGPVLKSMKRPLGEKGTRELVHQMRTLTPDISLRTTFIVGFPGETDADVESLAQFIGEDHFAHVGIFTYSQEEEAKSFTFENQIEESVKQERRDYLMEIQQGVVERCLSAKIGSRARVLIDGSHVDTDLLLSARAEWQAPETDGSVIINELDDSFTELPIEELKGRFCTVEFSEVAGYDLVGKVVDDQDSL